MPALKTQIENGVLLRSQGADLLESGVRYRTWCDHERVQVLLVRPDGAIIRTVALEAEGEGYFSAIDPEGQAGDLYRYQFNEGPSWPDPASRFQPLGVHGPSMVIDPDGYLWKDFDWVAPALRDLVIYELHLGTFTNEGTFLSAIEKLDHLVRLGVTALELMPIGDFPGDRNWGYDGVSLYAPSRAYGKPDDLRALIDAAHAHGLAVILDVVYNHLGPDGNYVGCYRRDYWNSRHRTPWGAGLNFEQPAVRNFFAENPEYWMREFHIDGFRLDATHAIEDDSERHVLSEIAERVQMRGGFVIAEDERNEPRLIQAREDGGLGLNGCWADDFHHVVRVMLTKDNEAYFQNYEGSVAELAVTLRNGWFFCGQTQRSSGRPRGGLPANATPEQFVYCISNHDQVGNRAHGERLGHSVSAAAYRAASALLCLVPQTPMIFMGQEWNASTPFQFFTDHGAELGSMVTAGRRREFRDFAAFRDPLLLETIPDPQAASTFGNSNLRWEDLLEKLHAGTLELYREFLHLRRTHPGLRQRDPESWKAIRLDEGVLAIVYRGLDQHGLAVMIDLIGGQMPSDLAAALVRLGYPGAWDLLLSSNEDRFGGEGAEQLRDPVTVVLEAR